MLASRDAGPNCARSGPRGEDGQQAGGQAGPNESLQATATMEAFGGPVGLRSGGRA